MELKELITKANVMNQLSEDELYSDPVRKEFKKIEMYCRKTYLMLVHTQTFLAEDEITENDFLEGLGVALVRDQKYIKARDSLGDYQIDG